MRQYPRRLLGPRPARRVVVLGTVAALVVAGLAVWWSRPFADVAPDGAVVPLSAFATRAGSSRLQHLVDAEVMLPGTTVAVTVGTPVDVLTRDVRQDVGGVRDDLSAPRAG